MSELDRNLLIFHFVNEKIADGYAIASSKSKSTTFDGVNSRLNIASRTWTVSAEEPDFDRINR